MSKTVTKSHKRVSLTLGLAAFEKISAVEGLKLTREMRHDLEALDRQRMSPEERTRFIVGKYGKKSD
jgi:hypothetical protein